MSRAFFLAVVVLMAVGVASPARAQTAVLFPVGGDAALASAHGAEVVERVTRDLEESSFTVLAGDALDAAMTAAHADACGDPSCAGPMLTSLSADLGVGVALWRRNGLVQVSVVLVDPHGVQVSADADGAEGVISQATQGALSQARARWATRGGSPVRVVGTPDGATITVDRTPWGTLPHEGALAPGTHHFVVSADGHVTERRDVEIAAASETLELTFELAAGADDGAGTTPHSGGPDVGLIATGAVVAAVGAGVLVTGLANVAAPAHCVSGCSGPPADRTIYLPNTPVDVALAVVGGAALIAGVVMVIVGVSSGSNGGSTVALTADGLRVSF